MLTMSRVMAFASTRLRMKWDMPFHHIEKVAIADTGITFADKGGREYDQFVPIKDAGSKNWFFQEIEKYVRGQAGIEYDVTDHLYARRRVIKQWNASRRVER